MDIWDLVRVEQNNVSLKYNTVRSNVQMFMHVYVKFINDLTNTYPSPPGFMKPLKSATSPFSIPDGIALTKPSS